MEKYTATKPGDENNVTFYIFNDFPYFDGEKRN